LWKERALATRELWTFAYEDGNAEHLPKAIRDAHVKFPLPSSIWSEKYRIVTK